MPTLVVVAAVVVAVDQLTKLWALNALDDRALPLGPVRLALTYNRGAAFGLGAGFAPVMAAAALLLVVALLVVGRGTVTPSTAVATGLVLGGAIGNLADRLFRAPGLLRGAVVDFIDLGWWPVFNLADSAITIGCVALILASRSRSAP